MSFYEALERLDGDSVIEAVKAVHSKAGSTSETDVMADRLEDTYPALGRMARFLTHGFEELLSPEVELGAQIGMNLVLLALSEYAEAEKLRHQLPGISD